MWFIDDDTLLISWDGGVVEWDVVCNRITKLFKYDNFSCTYFDRNTEAHTAASEVDATMKVLRLSRTQMIVLTSFRYYKAEKLFVTTFTNGTTILWNYTLGRKVITLKDPQHGLAYDCILSLPQKKAFTLLKRRKTIEKYRYPDDCEKNARAANLIRFWDIPDIPPSFIKGKLTIKQALLILFLHGLEQNIQLTEHELQSSTLESLREELRTVFKSFSPNEQAVLKLKKLPKHALSQFLFPLEPQS